MTFQWPALLWLLLLAPFLALLYLRLQQSRRQAAARFTAFHLPQGLSNEPGMLRLAPPFLFLIGMMAILFSLARPQATVWTPTLESTIVLAFDVSGSMAAEDLEPNRMEAAKAAAQIFINQLPPGVQVGVVSFSDSGFAVQAPGSDREAVVAAIQRLGPQRGTSLAQGIFTALNSVLMNLGQIEPGEAMLPNTGQLESGEHTADPSSEKPDPAIKVGNGSAAIVLLSDGENNMNPQPFEIARQAKEYGVPIYTIGIGTTRGSTLEIDGFQIHTRLDEETLQAIAGLTGGAYFNAQTSPELEEIYSDLASTLVLKQDLMEITALFASAGILLLLLGSVLSLAWFGRIA